jgi:argininosuccinate synthase
MAQNKRVVLAFSGGLDTSVILKWLQTELNYEVVCFTADLGQGEELESARDKALLLGIKPEHIYIEDLTEEFVKDYVFPMFRCNTVYEGQYLLGTSIARPLISKRLIEIADIVGADTISHGATGKGNDQVRFELAAYSLNPDIKIIAPWRHWDLNSRTKLIDFAEKHQIPISANNPEKAPDKPDYISICFKNGDPIKIDDKDYSPANSIKKLNEYGKLHGIGRLDLVENRFVGMKSRGVYETPGGTILLEAHRAIESLTLDSGSAHLKDDIMPRYAELIYNGLWFTPERDLLQTLIDRSQDNVEGTVKLKLYKGNVYVVSRSSSKSLYSKQLVTFEDDDGYYNQSDAEGFIKLKALRLRELARRNKIG